MASKDLYMLGLDVSSECRHSTVMLPLKQRNLQPGLVTVCRSGAVVVAVVLERRRRRLTNLNLRYRREILGKETWEHLAPVCSLEGIEEGIEGNLAY
jgi:hypothetical protein